MARQSRFIEPINASFEELAKAVVSPWPKEKEEENEKEKEASTSKSKKQASKNCKSSPKHTSNPHKI